MTRVSWIVSSSLPGHGAKSPAYSADDGRAKIMPASASAPGHEHQRVQEVVAEPPRIGLAVQRQMTA